MPNFGALPVKQLCEEWTAHGLSTEPADFDATEPLIASIYTRSGFKIPSQFVRLSSPLKALEWIAEYEAAHDLPEPVEVPSTGWQSAFVDHRGQVAMTIITDAWHTAISGVWHWVPMIPRNEIQDYIYPELEHLQELGYAILDEAVADIGGVGEETESRWSGSCGWGQFRSTWHCIFTAWGMLGADVSAWQPHMEIGRRCGFWWPGEDYVVMVDRPAEIGDMVEYRDGWTAAFQ